MSSGSADEHYRELSVNDSFSSKSKAMAYIDTLRLNIDTSANVVL